MEYEEGDISDYNTSEVDWGEKEFEPESDFQKESWRGGEASHRSWEREDNCDAETWSDETDSNISCGDDLGREEELEHEPPDHTWSLTYQIPHKSETPLTYELDNESDNESQFCELAGGRRGYLSHGESPDLNHTTPRYPKPRTSWNPSARAIFHPTYKSKTRLYYSNGSKFFGPVFFLFTGLDYLQWETNMHKYFWYYRIPHEEKLSIALGQLRGEALKWWDCDEYNRWLYNEPKIRTWEELKWAMCKRYSPKELLQPNQKSSNSPTTPIRTTNGNEKRVKLKTHLTFKEEMAELNKSFEHLISMIKRSSCPKVVETGVGTKEELDSTKDKPKALEELQPLKDVVSKQRIDHEDNGGTPKGTCCVLKSLELTCYRCNQPGHVAKFCPIRETSSTLTLVQQNLSCGPQVIAKTLTEPLQVCTKDTLLNLNEHSEPLLQIHMSNKEKESLDTEQIQEIVLSPKEEVISHTNDKDQTKIYPSDFSAPMTVLTHLSSAQKVEKVSGAKETITDQEEALMKEEFLDQNKVHGEVTPRLNRIAARDDESDDDPVQIKEEPPDAHLKSITKLIANYHANPSNTHTQGKYVYSLTVCDSDLLYTYVGNDEPLITTTLRIKEEPPDPHQQSQIKVGDKGETKGELRDVSEARPWDQICDVSNSMLMKEEPPQPPQIQPRGKLLHPHVLQWTNLVCLCVGKSVLRTKPLEEGGNDAALASEESPTITWTILSAHLRSTSKWNQPKRSSNEEVMAYTRQTDQNLPDLDHCALVGRFRPDQEEPSDVETCSGILTQRRSRESWNQVNSCSGSKVMIFPKRRILHLPHLEAAGFGMLQSYVWNPGEPSTILEPLLNSKTRASSVFTVLI